MKLILYPQGQSKEEEEEEDPLSALRAPSYFAPWKKKLFLVKDFVMRKIIDFGINKNYNYKK